MKREIIIVSISLAAVCSFILLGRSIRQPLAQQSNMESQKAVAVAPKLGSNSAASASKTEAEINTVKTYCQNLDFLWGSQLLTVPTFVKETERGSWKIFIDPWRKGADKPFVFKAKVWVRDAKPLLVDLDQWRPDKKATDTLKMCFRPDGTIAKTTLIVPDRDKQNNFITIGKIQYFNAKGQVLETQLASQNHKTHKWSSGGDLSRVQMPFYQRTTDLPFYDLIDKGIVKHKNNS